MDAIMCIFNAIVLSLLLVSALQKRYIHVVSLIRELTPEIQFVNQTIPFVTIST